MGWPLTAVAALVTYFAIRAAQRALHAERDGHADPDAPDPGGSVDDAETADARTD